MIMNKKVFLALSSMFILLIACNDKIVEPIVNNSNNGINMIDSTKGFHRVYSILDSNVVAGMDLKSITLTTQGSNRINVAYITDITNSVLNRTLNRFSVDYVSKKELKAKTKVPINWTTALENEFLQFAPFTDQLAYGYVHLNYYVLQGDLAQGTGLQRLVGANGRIAKSGQFVVNPFYFSDGIDKGFIYGYMKDNKWKSYWDYAGYAGNSPFNEGVFEPITGTNTGVLIAFHDDSVKSLTRNLLDTVKYHAVNTSAVGIKRFTIANTGKGTIIKNNETDNNFSFAIYGSDNMNRELIYRTFKYDYATKTITKVIDLGANFKSEVLAYDIDTDGNFYCIKTDKSIYKTTTTGTTKIADNVVLAGKPVLLKYLNGKVFLAVINKTDNFQLDIVVQD